MLLPTAAWDLCPQFFSKGDHADFFVMSASSTVTPTSTGQSSVVAGSLSMLAASVEGAIKTTSIILAIRSNLSRLPPYPESKEAPGELSQLLAKYVWSSGSKLLRTGLEQGTYEAILTRLLGQHQQWFLFDQPAREDHWFVSQATTRDGKN